jgi:hypothetical protein
MSSQRHWLSVIAAGVTTVLTITTPGDLASARLIDPCDELAAERRLEGAAGYQVRVSQDEASGNREQGSELADPYCEGLYRSPVMGLDALRLSVRSAYLMGRKIDPASGRPWRVVWPFVCETNLPGVGGPARIRAESVTDGANYRLDGIDSTPEECDGTCGPSPGTEFEIFTWSAEVLDAAASHRLQWRHVDVVVSRTLEHGGSAHELYLPVVLNPVEIAAQMAREAEQGADAMDLDVSTIQVRVSSSFDVDVIRCVTYPLGQPELARDVPESARPAALSRNQIEPFFIDVEGWQGRILRFDLGYRWRDADRVKPFYIYVPERSFTEAVVEHDA